MHQTYEQIATKLFDQASSEGLSPADYLLQNSARLSNQTWKRYRAALKYLALKQQNLELANQLARLIKAPRSQKTRTIKRAKYITQEQLDYLSRFFSDSQGTWIQRAWRLFQGSLHTGGRPIEWGCATYNPALWVLRFQNAKRGFDRQYDYQGHHRNLLVEGDLPALICAIIADRESYFDEILSSIEADSVEARCAIAWDQYRNRCSEAFSRAVRAAADRNPKLFQGDLLPILYTARHQFVANAKAAGITGPELAQLIGHEPGSDIARHWYGRKSRGREALKVRLVSDEEMRRLPIKPGAIAPETATEEEG